MTVVRMLLSQIRGSRPRHEYWVVTSAIGSLSMTYKSVTRTVSVDLNAEAEYERIKGSVSVKVLAISGDQAAAVEAAKAGTSALRKYLVDGGVLSASSPGAPIGYSVVSPATVL